MVAFQKMFSKLLVIYQFLLFGYVEPMISIPSKITVAASTREPFVASHSQLKTLKGSDVAMLTEFGKRFNISMEFVELDENLIELLNAKEPIEKFIRNVNISEIDLFIGGLMETVVTQNHLIASRSYHSDSLTWCVKKFQPAPAYQQIFYVITDGWVYPITTVLLMLTAFLAYYFNKFETFNRTYMEILIVALAAQINTSPSYYPKNTANRIFYALALFIGVIMSIMFGTFILKVVTDPFAKREIRSVDDILSNDLKLVGDRFSLSQLYQKPQSPIAKLKNFKIDDNLDFHLNQLSYDDELAVIVSRQYVLNKHLMEKTNIYCFKEPEIVYSYGSKVLMKKDFRFINELNNFIKKAFEGGLTKKWLAIEELHLQYDQVSSQYNLQNVTGLLIVFGILYILSILCFIAEIIIHKKVSQPNPSTFWIIAEIFIDPDRYFLLDKHEW